MTASCTYAPLARENRSQVLQNLRNAGAASGALYFRGLETTERRWTDAENPFRQESNFFYLTGVTEADCHLIIDLASGESHLLIPNYGKDHALWCGQPPTAADCKAKYGLDHAATVADAPSILKKLNPSTIHVLKQETNFSLLGDLKSKVETSLLLTAVTEARLIKSAGEIELMRKAAKISGDAHIALMKAVKPGHETEQQLHALFEYECFRKGGRYQAYTPIVASGRNGAILHYVDNTDNVAQEKRDMLLVDAACEYQCYAADITRTYPVGGKFEGDWKTTYEICLDMQKTVLAALKPEVEYEEMHRLANKVAAEGLLKAGLIKGSIDELIANHIPNIFFPHGLGHSIGLDVHDVGGYPAGVPRIDEPGLRFLRMRRTLKEGMVITIEPGIYFVDPILDQALADPVKRAFLNVDVVERFRKSVGGVRIEDDVVITKDGIDNLTGWVPKEIADIEKVMRA
ncbi:peptidase M24, structural domain-containing protein [Phlyctochytrium arcticum]|nr:peptidase M24, structural domain-containing protein [Phlyctochytrium arcticum]